MRYITEEYTTNWSPAPNPTTVEDVEAPEPSSSAIVESSRPYKIGGHASLEDFLGGSSDDEQVEDQVVAEPILVQDELEKYFSKGDCTMVTVGPNGQRVKFDLLLWWKEHEAEFPNLSRMAKQCLAFPASSAGVERLFSKAGKQYDNLSKNMKDETLKHRLMAASNYEPPPPKYKRLKARGE